MSNAIVKTEDEENESSSSAKISGLAYAEDELQCSICKEMFIKAATLSCSHTFCKFCISQWRCNHTICPICRAEIKMESPTLVLDNFINKIVENASDDLKKHREALVKEREPASVSTGPSGNGRRRPATEPIEISSSDSSSTDPEDDEDDDEDDSSHNTSCGQRGHWAKGYPTKRRR